MHRLFVALRPPAPLRQRLLAAMGGIAGARWQRDDQLHLTLRFIGEVDRHTVEDIAAALGTIHFPRFALALDGIGQFERKGRIDTLWAGVMPHDAIVRLHGKVNQALARVGIAPEARAFQPHITIARFARAAAPSHIPAHMLAMLPAGIMPSVPQEMTEFRLYESLLGQDGAVYTVVARYPLG